jgi:hypothetical protein
LCDKTGDWNDAIRAAKSTDPNVRRNALTWISQLGSFAAMAMPQLAAMATSDPDPKIRSEAIAVQIEIVGASLNDPSKPQNSRRDLAKLLGAIKHPRAADQLVKALDSLGPKYEHPSYLLFDLVDALKNQGDRRSAPALEKALAAQENAKAAGGMHYPDFIPKCRDALKKVIGGYTEMDALVDELMTLWKTGQDCSAPANKLIAIGDPLCITSLLEKFSPFCVVSGSDTSRAAGVLARFGKLAIKPLSAASESDNKNIKEIAMEALEKIKRQKGNP